MSGYHHDGKPENLHQRQYPAPHHLTPGQNGRLAVRNTVKNMVCNLESVISNLHGIVGDLGVLVHQIDAVTSQLDLKYGAHWDQPRASGNKPLKIKDSVSCGVCRWKTLQDSCDSAEFSPDIDWSYLGLGECNNNPIDVRQPSGVAKYFEVQGHSVSQGHIGGQGHNGVRGVQEHPRVKRPDNELSQLPICSSNKTAKYTDNLDLDISFDCLEIECHSSDVESDLPECPRVPSSISPVPNHAFCSEVSVDSAKELPYCGLYESVMESQLEACSLDSSFSECSDDEVEAPTVEAEYDRYVNPWTSFNLVHIDSTHGSSTHGSDERLSHCNSDILNDNYIDSNYINQGFDDFHPLIQQTIC